MPDESIEVTAEVDVTKVLTDVGTKHLIALVKAARKLLEGEVTGDNIADGAITPDKLVGMLIGSGAATGELEDLTIRTGRFINAGSGWNTFTFPEPFDGVPQVFAAAEGEYDVSVMSVSETGFLYRVSAGVGGTLDLTKSSYYVHTQKSTSTTYMVQASLVTDAELATSGGATADEASIMWVAVEFGGA